MIHEKCFLDVPNLIVLSPPYPKTILPPFNAKIEKQEMFKNERPKKLKDKSLIEFMVETP